MSEEWNYMILATFVCEVVFFAVMEYKIWRTMYTPLNILMLPFSAILFLSMSIVKILNLYPFVYESIIIWQIGLLVFAIPSWVTGLLLKNEDTTQIDIQLSPISSPKVVVGFIMLLLAVYGYHLKSILSSSVSGLGSDQFAEEAAAGGVWSHVFVMIMVVEMFCAYHLSKKRWYFIFPIVICLVYCVLNQVKGWVIIPLVCAILIKIFTGRLHITIRMVLIVVLGGFGFFFLSYYLSLVMSKDKEFTDDVLYFIFKNFFHYLSSGVLGLSMDMDRGVLEQQSVTYLFTPFVNIFNLITGQKFLSNLNGYYLQTTWPGLGTNIRSFMGTIYVYGRSLSPLIVLLFSSISYFFRFMMVRKRTTVWIMLNAWFCSLLFMGWFDYYFALLIPYEVMVLIAVVVKSEKLLELKTKNNEVSKI